MSLAGLTIFLDRLSTTKTDTVLFFWSSLTSSKLNIRSCSCTWLDMAFAHWSKSTTSTWIFGGAFQIFSLPSFSWSLFEVGETFFKGELFNLFWSGGGAFLWGEGLFLFCSGGVVFLGGDFEEILSSGGGPFFSEGDFVFFFGSVGGSPLLGGNRAFMAEPSDRPAINDGVGGRKKGGRLYEKKVKK